MFAYTIYPCTHTIFLLFLLFFSILILTADFNRLKNRGRNFCIPNGVFDTCLRAWFTCFSLHFSIHFKKITLHASYFSASSFKKSFPAPSQKLSLCLQNL